MAAPVVGGLLVVWFSKDRSLQLSEAVRTFTRFAALPPNCDVRHVVLYGYSSSEHARCYDSLASVLTKVSFVDEMSAPPPPTLDQPTSHSHSPSTSDFSQSTPAARQSHFAAHLRSVLESSTERFILFCVDDVLFVADFSLAAILALFASSQLLSYHMALHPALSFHHPSSSPLTLPTFTSPSQSPTPPWPPSLVFSHSGAGSHDFRYPFSLVASFYRLTDVRCIVQELSRSSSLPFHHPNLFESSVNSLITTHSAIPAAVRSFLPPPSPSDSSALSTLRPLSGLPSRPLCVVITVNRVQDVYSNAVFSSADGGVAAMLARFESGGWQLDEDAYGEMAEQGHFTSVHVGELLWKRVNEASRTRRTR